MTVANTHRLPKTRKQSGAGKLASFTLALSLLSALGLQTLSSDDRGEAIPASDSVYTSAATAFGPITNSGNCSTSNALQLPAQTLADTLDDAWETDANADTVVTAFLDDAPLGPLPAAGFTVDFPGTPVTATVTSREVLPADRDSLGPNTFGTASTLATPELSNGNNMPDQQMQDCAPKPMSLIDYNGGPLAGPTPMWNAVGGSLNANSYDAVLFEFNQPIRSFGAWFGDIESRIDDSIAQDGSGGELAYIKLFDVDGNVLALEPILPNDQRANGAENADDEYGCGDPDQNDDFSSCGNHGTRFLGFNRLLPDVAAFEVIVGDDDHCGEVGTCHGLTEHVSFIGPTVAINNAELQIDKSTTSTVVSPGDNVEFSLSIVNNGDIATNPTIEGVLPEGLTYVSDSLGGAIVAGQTITWNPGPLAGGATLDFTVTAVVDDPPLQDLTLINNATVSWEDQTDSDDAQVNVVYSDLSLQKVAGGDYRPSGEVTWNLTASNQGPSPATNVVLSDTLPADVQVVSAEGEGWDCTIAGQQVECLHQGDMPVGVASPVVVTGLLSDSLAPGAQITNRGILTSDLSDPTPEDLQDTATFVIAEGLDRGRPLSPAPTPVPAAPNFTG